MIELPYPAKALWPNGRAHWAAKHRATKKHREWARLATLADRTRPDVTGATRIKLKATFYPKTRNVIDADNAVGSLKAYADGIADALKVNDNCFLTPEIQFGEPVRNGKVVIGIEVAP